MTENTANNTINAQDHKNSYVEMTFKEQDFSQQEFISKEFDNCTFIKCNFNEALFNKCKFCECDFKECNLSLIKVKLCVFTDTVFENSKIIGVNWAEAAWPLIKLSCPLQFFQCNLSHSSFFGLSLAETTMVECKAHEVDFREADLSNADFSQTDFTHSLFGKTKLSKANFTDAVNYHIDVFENNIKQAKFALPEAMALLHSLDIEIVNFD